MANLWVRDDMKLKRDKTRSECGGSWNVEWKLLSMK
jgi:hypothetical protein